MADDTPKSKQPKAETPPAAPAAVKQVKLRYLGSSTLFKDATTDLIWRAGGDVHEVSEADAKRLQNVSRYDIFEEVK